MAAIEVSGLRVAYGSHVVLHDLDLVVEPGSITAVLGPSGCGKTSLLRVVAGLLRPVSGRVTLGSQVVAGEGVWVRPERRRVGIVPQEGGLFPHLDVLGNVAFGLEGSRSEKAARVGELLALVGMQGTESLRPQELSGGMQQRVAVARALSRRPDVVLLDEPFSALDAGLRDEVRGDVLAAIRADGATAMLVTHDQDEALSSADRVAVMRDGVIVQEGTPIEVYASPVDLGVARFVGQCVELSVIAAEDGSLRTALGPAVGDANASGVAFLRPEDLELSSHDGSVGVPARVEAVRYHGHDCLVDVALHDGTRLPVRLHGSTSLRAGDVGFLTSRTPARVLPASPPEG